VTAGAVESDVFGAAALFVGFALSWGSTDKFCEVLHGMCAKGQVDEKRTETLRLRPVL